MNEKDDLFKVFNKKRERTIKSFDYIKLYNKARELHYKVIDALYDFYKKHEKDIVLINKRRELSKAVTFKSLDLSKQEELNFFLKNAIYYGYYRDKRLINHLIARNNNMDVDYIKMLGSIENCFCSIFKVISANPLLATIEIKDLLTNKTYFVVDRGLSTYAGIAEFKNGYYICSTLTTFDDISFFDNTILIDQDNPSVVNFLREEHDDLTSIDISYFAYFQKTQRVVLERETRDE